MRVTPIKAVLICLITGLVGCGRALPPSPPEAFSPQEVQDLVVVANQQGVLMKWSAPADDLRGKELKDIDGYSLVRKEIVQRGDLLDDSIEFEEVAFVEDLHIKLRDEIRKTAREQNRPSRRLDVDKEFKQFEYLDREVQAGRTYVYKILPTNQDGVEGRFTQWVKVLYRGDTSEVNLVPVGESLEAEF